ncbi:MAG: efflux RND transporter periplasmic adaptor subunit [Planctomycetota bacterium]
MSGRDTDSDRTGTRRVGWVRRGWRGVAACGLGSLLVLVAAGCDQTQAAAPPPPPNVEVATPETRTITEYFFYTGTLEPVDFVEIRARVGGELQAINFEESSNVEEGDVLFVIEKEPYELAVGQARASLERAEAAEGLAEVRVQRYEDAFARQAANEFELIEERAKLKQAQADVLAAQEALKAAELDLSYTDVKSPITGRIDRHFVDRGNLVGAQLAGGGEATLLATVVTMDPIHVSFDVSEAIALQYLGQGDRGERDADGPSYPPIELALADEDDYPHAGRVDFVDNQLDGSTGTLLVRAELDNPTRKLFPGLFARIRVPWQQREDALCVVEEAVGTGLEGKFLLIVGEGNMVERRPVVLGERQDDGTIVVLEGLAAGETYIVRGLQKARPGAPVTPTPFGQPAPAAPAAQPTPEPAPAQAEPGS